MVDFIGLGAQKSGTSWAYTCLYEHPEICMPIKELHFFSRPRYQEGVLWYNDHFTKCSPKTKSGEWSTSYLYTEGVAERIHAHYPDAKLLVILRNPIDRAYSQYRNAIRAGEISKETTFEAYESQEKSVLGQGLYGQQLFRFLKFFPREQICILIYEDIAKDPIAFMRRIHEFLGIRPDFVSSMVHAHVNVARTPKMVGLDRGIHYISEFLRKHGLDRFVHFVRKSGLTDVIRRVNTEGDTTNKTATFDRAQYIHFFKDDVKNVGELLGRNLSKEWNI